MELRYWEIRGFKLFDARPPIAFVKSDLKGLTNVLGALASSLNKGLMSASSPSDRLALVPRSVAACTANLSAGIDSLGGCFIANERTGNQSVKAEPEPQGYNKHA
eukprot:1183862-Prorocentrum_minimum.AAC.2